MTVENNSQIIEMLDSIEAAIGEEAWGSPTAPPPSAGISDHIRASAPAPAAPAGPVLRAERCHYPDPPPRPVGIGALVRGTAGDVLAAFKWGIEK